MTTKQRIWISIMVLGLGLAGLVLLANPAHGVGTSLEVVQNGSGHCANGPAGPSSQTRIAIRPKVMPAPVVTVTGDMQQQGTVTGEPNAWIVHLIGAPDFKSGTVTVSGSYNGSSFSVTVSVTIDNRAQCGDTTPTCETDQSLCPPPVEPTCETDASLCPPPVEHTCEQLGTCPTEVPAPVPTVLAPPAIVTNTEAVPTPPTATPTAPPALAYTGSTTDLLAIIGATVLAVGAIVVQLSKAKGRKHSLR